MKESKIEYQGSVLRVFYELPFRYGYAFMLKAALYMNDGILQRNLNAVLLSDLPGSKMRDVTSHIKMHNYEMEKCRVLHKEHGVMCIKGSMILDGQSVEMELAMINQSSLIRLSVMPGQTHLVSIMNGIMDDILSNTQAVSSHETNKLFNN